MNEYQSDYEKAVQELSHKINILQSRYILATDFIISLAENKSEFQILALKVLKQIEDIK